MEKQKLDRGGLKYKTMELMETKTWTLKRFILSLIPKKLGEDVAHIAHFAVKDIGKTT